MKTRIIAGVIAAAGLMLLLFKGSPILILIAILTAAAIAYDEYDRLFFERDLFRQVRLTAMVLFTIFAMRDQTLGWIVLWICMTFLCAGHVLEANYKGAIAVSVRDLAYELLGYLYIVGIFGFMMPIVESGGRGREFLLLLYFIVFGGDTAAYFIGSRFGRHKLSPAISPGKSVEGAIAALVAAIFMTALWTLLIFRTEIASPLAIKVLLFAPLGSILAQLGDLFESLLKRSQARKDSGHFLPGHGGILDRLDGLLLISPVFYFYLIYILERE